MWQTKKLKAWQLKKLKMWQNSKTQKTFCHSKKNCGKTQNLELWQNSKPEIDTKLNFWQNFMCDKTLKKSNPNPTWDEMYSWQPFAISWFFLIKSNIFFLEVTASLNWKIEMKVDLKNYNYEPLLSNILFILFSPVASWMGKKKLSHKNFSHKKFVVTNFFVTQKF